MTEYTIHKIIGKCNYGHTAKDVANNSNLKWATITIAQAFDMVADGYAFFPLWGRVEGGAVTKYSALKMKIAFVNWKQWKQFKKEYEEYA